MVTGVGHLFVAQGDLTRLACDGILIPCDSELSVNAVWRSVLPAGLPCADAYDDWLTLPSEPGADGVVALTESEGRAVWAYVAVDVARDVTPDDVVDRTWKALEHLATNAPCHGGRARPLIGLPLPGTGAGGLATRRGEVIDRLLERFRRGQLQIDVALILFDRRDFAAVQERRRSMEWPELSDGLRDHADRLGRLAARRELSLFLGAGISMPVGLPGWWDLLDTLAEKADQAPPSRDSDPFRAARPIVEALGAEYHAAIQEALRTDQHGIGHALLASLGVTRVVTTNFDCCLEGALEIPASGDFRVLTRELAQGGSPWVLKVNGDVEYPQSIVLTDADLTRAPEERRALEGVIQGLLLTSHLLFVGFSLTDTNFLELAKAVSGVRSQAKTAGPAETGTALGLTSADCERAGYRDLHMLAMDPESPQTGARRMEIFLDRLLWTASVQSDLSHEYLLDRRYESGLSEPDSALRALLVEMVNAASPLARSSSGWRKVVECLADLGADIR
ncbi:hypothetical protein MPNTM1_00395 [Mycolicibacterium parafortuitum]|uniref:SIR2 family NAD-dependent protein deacylase n=1 Tax=Mycolicibacterium parafortuitum TaxID=39692 RepID=UPI0032C45A0B